MYTRTFLNELAKGKNFIQKNRDQIARPETAAQRKLDRIKRLQRQTQMLLNGPLAAECGKGPKQLSASATEQFLHDSVKKYVYDEKSRPTAKKPGQDGRPWQEDAKSGHTVVQFTNLGNLQGISKAQSQARLGGEDVSIGELDLKEGTLNIQIDNNGMKQPRSQTAHHNNARARSALNQISEAAGLRKRKQQSALAKILNSKAASGERISRLESHHSSYDNSNLKQPDSGLHAVASSITTKKIRIAARQHSQMDVACDPILAEQQFDKNSELTQKEGALSDSLHDEKKAANVTNVSNASAPGDEDEGKSNPMQRFPSFRASRKSTLDNIPG